MSVGDLYDVESTGEFAVTRIRRRPRQPKLDTAQKDATQSDATQIDATKRAAIAVLTDDATLADTIHDAAGASHPVATASTLDEAIELAAHGRCGILITDRLSTPSALRQMTQRLRAAQPALVVVAVGNSGDQGALISLLSAGIVDRLMLKPLTTSLAQTVIKSAVQQHRTLQSVTTAAPLIEQPEPAVALVDLQRHAAGDLTQVRREVKPSPAEVVAPASTVGPATPARPSPPSRRRDLPRPSWIAVAAALLAVAGLMWWIAGQHKPAIDPQAIITSNLAAAQRAFREGHALDPRGRSALDYYNTVLALDPANATAHKGIDQIADRFAVEADAAIGHGQVAAAIVALDSIRRVRPEYPQLQQLEQRLDAAQAKLAAVVPEHVEPAPQPPTKAAAAAAISSSAQQKVEAQARAVSEAAAALKRDQQELANAQRQFAAKIEAAEAQLAAAHKQVVELPPIAAPAPEPAAAAPAPPTLRLARMVQPEYPYEAQRSGTEGWVNVSLSVTPAGNVIDPRVEQSSNGTLFNRAALTAVRKWRYEPFASADPLATQRLMVRVEFRMQARD
jgi:protein TonB